MKKRLSSLMLALALILGMFPVLSPTAQAFSDPIAGAAQSDRGNPLNVNSSGNYEVFMVDGTLVYMQDGSLRDDRHLMVRTYSPDFQFLSEKELKIELQEIGGVFFGQNYNFVVFGQDNWDERDDIEALRIVKYSKNWDRLDAASLCSNTVTDVIGQWGNLAFAEYNGMLYIHSGRSTNTLYGGSQHQTNMTFCIRQSDMVITDTRLGITPLGTGYVSHALTQDILVDAQGRLVTADTGDAASRGAYLFRYDEPAGNDTFYNGEGEGVILAEWPGKGGDVVKYPTNAQITSLAETDQGYLVAYIDTGRGSLGGTGYPYSAYLTFVDKENLSDYTTRTLQSNPQYGEESAWGVQLIPTSSSSGYVLWYTTGPNENWIYSAASLNDYHYYYTTYHADGSFDPPVDLGIVPGAYAGPLYHDGKLIWADINRGAENIRFCTLDSSGVKVYPVNGSTSQSEPDTDPTPVPSQPVSFSDVPTTHWAYPYITRAAEMGWVSGVGNGKFAPNDTMTFAEFYAMVVPIFAADELADYQPPAGSPWWQPYMWVGGKYIQATTIWRDTFFDGPPHMAPDYNEELQKSIDKHANEPITRADAISIMWNVMGGDNASQHIPGVEETLQKLLDSGVDQLYVLTGDEVAVCYVTGLISGDENGDLNLGGTLTRAEGCTMLCKLVDYMLTYGWMTGTGDTIPFHLPEAS